MNWKICETNTLLQEKFSREMGTTPLFAQLLVNRGILTSEEAREFLFGDLDGCHDPFLMKGMRKAVERILKALREGEKILVYGDYDVDGVTSTALLSDVLSRMGADCDTFIPNRLEEGYGLNIRAVVKARDLGVKLIISVDCGINSVEEVACAREHGIDVVVTDHHEVKANERPEAVAIIDPHQDDCSYPFQFLAGVGVAYKLAKALSRGSEDLADSHLDLVALGTVADIVPQKGENRVLTKAGLRALKSTRKPGLKALMEVARVDPEKLTCRHIGFGLAPRINAMGRVGSANTALELLLEQDASRARELASRLDTENRNRQNIEKDILRGAIEKVETEVDLGREEVIVLADRDWHPGVVGIVASRLTEAYSRPAILIALDGDSGKGSGRSVAGFNLFDAIDRSGHELLDFGGHEQACGVKIRSDRVAAFRRAVNTVAPEIMAAGEDIAPELEIDLRIPFSYVGMKLVKELALLMPYGPGNREPVFSTHGVRVKNAPRDIGRNGFKFFAQYGDMTCEAITFRKNAVERPRKGDIIDLAYTPSVNSWNGIDSIQLNIKDLIVV